MCAFIIDSGVATAWVRERRRTALGQGSVEQSGFADAAGVGGGVVLAALPAAARAWTFDSSFARWGEVVEGANGEWRVAK